MKKVPYAAVMTFALCCLQCLFFLGSAPLFGVCRAEAAEGASVKALLEKDAVSYGEPFIMQIRVDGIEIGSGVAPPDMSAVSDFTVESLGGRSNSSSSITIVNGSMSKVESFGYVYSYRLTPKKRGKLAIPPIEVPIDAAGSKRLRTAALSVNVTEPEAGDDFHLELKFSKTRFYVGEPVILTVTWLIGKDVEEAAFNLPILKEEAFTFADPEVERDPGKQYFQLPIGGTSIAAEKGSEVYNGKEYTTLSFKKALFAKRPGRFTTPEATVSCKTLAGYSHQPRRRNPFDVFDDDFFNPGRRAVYKTFVSRSEPVALTALELPEEGKPAGFFGWVGRFRLEASASPTELSIGDPLTLTLSVSGPEHLGEIELPPLSNDPEIEKSFKIPEEMAAGTLRGSTKEFTQTLRPKNAEIQAIPAIKIPFFNPDSGRYETAESKPIPLKVKQAKALTSSDVEGAPQEAPVRKSALEEWSRGIAYNYEGPQILERSSYKISGIVRSPIWIASTLLPFFAFMTLTVFVMIRRRRTADPEGWKSRKALGMFEQRICALKERELQSADSCGLLLEALRSYIGDKLRCNGAAMTISDVEAKLEERGVDMQVIDRLKPLFHACELGSYGGMESERPREKLAEEALEAIRSLDRAL